MVAYLGDCERLRIVPHGARKFLVLVDSRYILSFWPPGHLWLVYTWSCFPHENPISSKSTANVSKAITQFFKLLESDRFKNRDSILSPPSHSMAVIQSAPTRRFLYALKNI
jgi:hypothetical protein